MSHRVAGWLRFLWDVFGLPFWAMAFKPPRYGRMVPLLELDPHWLPDPEIGGRHMTGLGFLCPLHRDHRVWLYFRQPLDEGEPIVAVPLYDIENAVADGEVDVDGGVTPQELKDVLGQLEDPFARISVTDIRNQGRPIVYACGARFWVAGGTIVLSTF